MNADAQAPAKVVCISPTEMVGDWPAEVARKLVDQGLDPRSAAQIAVEAEEEMLRRAAEAQASKGPSLWQRLLGFLGLAT